MRITFVSGLDTAARSIALTATTAALYRTRLAAYAGGVCVLYPGYEQRHNLLSRRIRTGGIHGPHYR